MGSRSNCQSAGSFGKKQWARNAEGELISVMRPNCGRDLSKRLRVKRRGQRSITAGELLASMKQKKHISTGAAAGTQEIQIGGAKKSGIIGKIGNLFQRKGA